MRIERITLCILALSGIFSAYASDWAFTGIIPGGHRGPVSALVYKGDIILSAGEDGFLELWNINATGGHAGGNAAGHAVDRFQVSPYRIIAMAGRPETDEVCIVESDGLGLYRIAAWNYKERRNIFTLPMRDPIAHVYYAAGGTFIIAARAGRAGLIFIDSVSGNTRPSPQSLSGTVGPAVGLAVGLAVTGRTERNMLVYFSSGALSYWDLESGNETNHFEVPADLRSPVLFSNNRYLAGINTEGLTVINAVSGELLAQDSSIPGGSLLCPAGDDFICVVQQKTTELYRYTIGRTGRLVNSARFSLSAGGANAGDNGAAQAPRDNYFTAIAAGTSAGAIVLGTADGTLIANRNGQQQTLTIKEQLRITEAAVSGSALAFIGENGTMGFIPVNYNLLLGRRTIRMEPMQGDFNRVTAFAEKDAPDGQFVFWHDRNIRSKPLILSSSPGDRKLTLSDITFRFPVQSVDSLGEKILFLDSTGNLTVVSPPAAAAAPKSPPFTFFSVGLLDAAFIDRSRIIISRSAISGNTPFMIINIDTGETVPLSYPAQAGVMLHRGASGSIYAVTVDSSIETNGIKTSIVQLNLADIARSIKLADFQGEDTQFSIAESPGGTAGSLAATMGGESAAIFSDTVYHKLERTAGLPFRLIDGGQYLISLDRDGAIAWHENRSGKLLAVFRLHPNGWTLQTEQRTITGAFNSQ